jgi:hypothetical protein
MSGDLCQSFISLAKSIACSVYCIPLFASQSQQLFTQCASTYLLLIHAVHVQCEVENNSCLYSGETFFSTFQLPQPF